MSWFSTGGLTLDVKGYRQTSKEIKGVLTRGVLITWAASAATWSPSWAGDGARYSAWTDGWIEGYFCNSNLAQESTCQAKIVGHDPLNLDIVNLGRLPSGPKYYPCVSLIAGDVFYIGQRPKQPN